MKTYYIDGLDCANCAMRIENKLNELEIFESASLNFAAGEIRVNPAEGAEEPFEAICAVVRQLEPAATVFKSKPITPISMAILMPGPDNSADFCRSSR